MEIEKIKKWLDDEIGRTKGSRFEDFSESDQDELIEIYNRVKDIKKAVEIWSFS